MSEWSMLFYLIAGHSVADYPLQGDFLARAKNHVTPVAGVPWGIALFAHAIIHGAFVAAITGSVALGMAETVVHAAIDYAKCDGWTNLVGDQALHVACKVVWLGLLSVGVV
jgi:hypothetical protein